VVSLRSSITLNHVVLNAIAFFEGLIFVRLDRTLMYEDLRCAFTAEKAVTP
jgi:hypothetical protein